MWRCSNARADFAAGIAHASFYKGELPEAPRKLLTNKQKAVFEVGRGDVVTCFERKPLGG